MVLMSLELAGSPGNNTVFLEGLDHSSADMTVQYCEVVFHLPLADSLCSVSVSPSLQTEVQYK